MRKIGLVGGTGPESTLVYYKQINTLVNAHTKGKQFPEIAIESVDLYKALDFVENKNYLQLRYYLMNAISNLVAGGAEIIALTAGTMHIVYDELKTQIPVPFISIPETVSEVAFEKGYKKVGLLGTKFTMQEDYLKKSFVERGIKVIVPERQDLDIVNSIIASELEFGIVNSSSVEQLINIITKMRDEQGIEAIILGCTELPLALNSNNCPVDCLDIMEIHIKELVKIIVE